MGRESTSYFLALAPQLEDAVVLGLREGGAELIGSSRAWTALRVHDPHRYWIDLRVHRGPEPRLEIRIALTNDEWSIRAPLEDALSALPPAASKRPLRDEDGGELGVPGRDDWSLRLEEDYGRRRADFVERVGDFTAPLPADQVYLYVHQTRWQSDTGAALAWRRDREIGRMKRMWEGEPRQPDEHPDGNGR